MPGARTSSPGRIARGSTQPEIDRLPEIAGALRDAARRFGTPLYVTDERRVVAAAADLEAAFPDPWIRPYSVKANDVAAVVRLVTAAGGALGANVVSRGEWAIASRAGVPNARITLEGIGKTDADLAAAVRSAAAGEPLAWLTIESPDELDALVAAAARAGLGRDRRASLDVLYRLNPDVQPETHAALAVGRGGSKFGMTETELSAAVERTASTGPALRPRGVHLHVGSQLGAVDAWRDAVRRGLAVVGLLRGGVSSFDTLDVGGGFAVAPLGEPAPTPARFARELPRLLAAIPPDRQPTRFAVEPGRFLVARAGWLVARVLHARDRDGRQVVLDAGMTELIRPALYGARHGIVALTSGGRPVEPDASAPAGPVEGAPAEVADVHGPICESTDDLGEHQLPHVARGDLVVIRDAGAYAASLASTYNGRPRPAQVILTAAGDLLLARRRGSLSALG